MTANILQFIKPDAETQEEDSRVKHQELIASVIMRALTDLQLEDWPGASHDWPADDWIMEEGSRHRPFSFAWCCDALAHDGNGDWLVSIIQRTAEDIICGKLTLKHQRLSRGKRSAW